MLNDGLSISFVVCHGLGSGHAELSLFAGLYGQWSTGILYLLLFI
jgi:hypothetical protein